MALNFFPVFFWISLLPLAVTLGVTYWKNRKIYPLLHVLAVFSYADTVIYVIDAFNLGRNGIIAALTVSALLLIGIGWYIGHRWRR